MCENHDQLQHDTYDIHKHQLFRERETNLRLIKKMLTKELMHFCTKIR